MKFFRLDHRFSFSDERFVWCLIIFLMGWAYFPSLFHIPRHDQVAYWAETAGKNDFFSLTVGSYALNRGRLFNPGDEILFRPLLYCFLGLERWLWGHTFLFWQLCGIVLHGLCVWRLWRLLKCIYDSIFALYMSGFFALLFVNVEMVIWQNVNAYIIACILLLYALEKTANFFRTRIFTKKDLAVTVGSLVAASFFYEAAALFSLCLYFRFKLVDKETARLAWWFLLPLLVLCSGSAMDLLFRQAAGTPMLEGSHHVNILRSVLFFFLAAKWSLMIGLFSWAGDVFVFFRTVMNPRTYLWGWPLDSLSWMRMPGVFLIGAYITLLWTVWLARRQAAHPPQDSANRNMAGIVVWCLVAYWGLISFGRMSSRGVMVGLGINLYYQYVIWLFVVIVVYASVDFHFLRSTGRFCRIGRWLRGVIIVFILWNAFNLRLYNTRMADWQKPTRQLLLTVDGLVQRHGHEPGFSFYVDADVAGNVVDPWLKRRQDPLGRKYTVVEALYFDKFDSHNPLYLIAAQANDKK